MAHICEIPELTQNTGHYGALFAKLIAAQKAFIEKLVTSEAFINKLATNEAFIDRLITKRLLVDSDTASPNNFELAINEGVGIQAKKNGEKVFEVTLAGNIFAKNANMTGGTFVNINCIGNSKFSGEIDSGPLLLKNSSPVGLSYFKEAGADAIDIYEGLKAAGFQEKVISPPHSSTARWHVIETDLSLDSYYGSTALSYIKAVIKEHSYYYVYINRSSSYITQARPHHPESQRVTVFDLFVTTTNANTKTIKLRNLPKIKPVDKEVVWVDSNGFLRIG